MGLFSTFSERRRTGNLFQLHRNETDSKNIWFQVLRIENLRLSVYVEPWFLSKYGNLQEIPRRLPGCFTRGPKKTVQKAKTKKRLSKWKYNCRKKPWCFRSARQHSAAIRALQRTSSWSWCFHDGLLLCFLYSTENVHSFRRREYGRFLLERSSSWCTESCLP